MNGTFSSTSHSGNLPAVGSNRKTSPMRPEWRPEMPTVRPRLTEILAREPRRHDVGIRKRIQLSDIGCEAHMGETMSENPACSRIDFAQEFRRETLPSEPFLEPPDPRKTARSPSLFIPRNSLILDFHN